MNSYIDIINTYNFVLEHVLYIFISYITFYLSKYLNASEIPKDIPLPAYHDQNQQRQILLYNSYRRSNISQQQQQQQAYHHHHHHHDQSTTSLKSSSSSSSSVKEVSKEVSRNSITSASSYTSETNENIYHRIEIENLKKLEYLDDIQEQLRLVVEWLTYYHQQVKHSNSFIHTMQKQLEYLLKQCNQKSQHINQIIDELRINN